jgi:type I restriction enzyme R subunit
LIPPASPNIAYLAYHDARLVALATQAEQHIKDDPSVTLFKLRQFVEVLAQRAAAKVDVTLARLKDESSAGSTGERPRRSKAAQ